ncbi:MAG: amino acid adenylation domain-containing protein [Acidobacteriota bacterium]|nr:amino acid adenylation domain-containing protein [Acidobacteriota bacterium]
MRELRAFFSHLKDLKIKLWEDNGKLKISAPKGALTPELSKELKERKAEILLFFREISDLAGARKQEAIPRASREGELPLSFAQQRLWFLDQLEGPNPTYNIPTGLRFKGNLNVDLLRRCGDEIAKRHEAVRTRFPSMDGRPSQVIEPPGPADFRLLDRPDLAEDMEALREMVSAEFAFLFNLAEGPLLRQTLIRLGPHDHVFVVVMHHIISDGWSQGVLVNELVNLYRAFYDGRPSPLPELQIQYVDYAGWQRQHLSGENLERQMEFWRKQLSGSPGLLEMPTDFQRPAIQRFFGDRVIMQVGRDSSAKLNALTKETGATLFMVLLAIYKILLSRYSGQDDITVGSPIAGRGRKELEPLVGFFVNTLVLRTDIGGLAARDSEPLTFRTLLKHIRENTLDAYAHQDVPFEKLVEELVPDRKMSHSPLFQVMFVLQNTESGELKLPDLEIEPVGGSADAAKFDLSLNVGEMPQGIVGTLEFNTDLFTKETAQRLSAHYAMLASQIAADPDIALSRLSLLDDEERRTVLEVWNDTAVEYDYFKTVHGCIETQAARTPDAPAVVFAGNGDENPAGGDMLTYAQLNERADRLAAHLRGLGVDRNTPVGICAERSLEMVVGLLGILKSGGAYVPLDPDYPSERLNYMLEDARVPVLLVQGERNLNSDAATVVQLEDLPSGPVENPEPATDPEDMVYMIYTSGSTGKPKGAANRHSGVVNRLYWMQEAFGLTENDRVLQKTPFSFDVSAWEFFWPLMFGARMVLARPQGHKDPVYMADLIQAQGATTMHFVPSMLEVFLAEDVRERAASLRRVFCSGEALQPELVHRFFNNLDDTELHNLYGPTEAAIDVTWWKCSPDDRQIPIGRAVANTQIYIVDRNFEPVPAGVHGELCIGGANLARGYHNRPAMTAEKFVPDPFLGVEGARLYRTGDRCRFLPDGNIAYMGRIDFQVKLRGLRIELGEIEARLMREEGVREAVVLCREDRPGDKRLVAYVMLDEQTRKARFESDLIHDWREAMLADLPEYMVPSAMLILDTFPLTPNGKLDRGALPAPEPMVSNTEYIPPANPAEELLANIWAEILGVSQVGRNDHFFMLGGHSLLATQVVSRIRDVFGVELPVRAMFEHPLLSELADSVETGRAEMSGRKAPPIVPISREDKLPFSFAQERLWFLDQLEGPTSTYNMPSALEMIGVLDLPSLERALNGMLQRHESLRTTFDQEEGIPFQVIADHVDVRLPLIDISHLPEAERDAALQELSNREALAPFNLKTGPLLRLTLIYLAPNRHAVLLTMHHIISDGWSMGVFVGELVSLYNSFSRGEEHRLPPLPYQYADFAGWQRTWLSGEELDRQVGYWKEKLGSDLNTLDFPTDRPRPAIMTTFHGAKVGTMLESEVGAKLNAVARQHGASLFMVLLAGFKLLLARICGQYDVTVGTPIAGRNRSGMENLIGCFLNSLVLRTDLSGDPNFIELIARVRETSLGAYEHADIPFEKLLEELQVQRDRSRTPLFQIFFNMLNLPEGGASLPDLEMRPVSMPDIGAKFDIELYVSELHNGALHFSISYNTDLFDEDRMQAFAGQYKMMLEQLVAKPEQPVSEFSLITPESAELIPDPTAPLETTWQGSVNDWFERAAERRPDHPALIMNDEEWTYEDLAEKIEILARQLSAAGLEKGERVAIYGRRGPELAVAIMAAMKAGGVFLMLDPAFPTPRLIDFLDIANPRIWLQLEDAEEPTEELEAFVEKLDCRAGFLLDDEGDCTLIGAIPGSGDPPEADVTVTLEPDDPAVIGFTSGSTGRPKGIVGRHGSLTHFLPWMIEEFNLTEDDRYSMLSGLSHDPLQREIFTPLCLGATLCIPEDEDFSPGGLARWYDRHKITFTNLTPAMSQILTGTREDLTLVLRTAFYVGDRLTGREAVMLRILAPEVTVINTYGSTETQRAVGYYRVPEDKVATTAENVARLEKVQPLGVGMKNAQLLVRNQDGQMAGVGELGEIYMRSPHMALGYLDDPERTGESFIANPFTDDETDRLYKTGDMGRYLADGNVAFHARADFQLKLRGFRIEPGDIESVLERHPDVSRAVVMLREATATSEAQLVAYTQVKAERITQLEGENEGDLLDKTIAVRQELNKQCREALPGYMCPGAFVLIEQMPLTPNRKIDRKALLKLKVSKLRPEGQYVAPRSNLELKLVHIWEDLLGVTPIGVTDNWFELGGHSLLAVQLMSRIKAEFDVEFYLASLFQGPNIESFAVMLAGEGVTESSCVVAINPLGSRRPFFCLHPGGGTVLCYQDLSHLLGPDQPFYGVQSRVLLGKEPLKDLKEMVAEYVEGIKQVQPEGPYRVGGWSLGGLLAFETARQLVAGGDEVDLLVIVDTYPLALVGSGPIEDTAIMLMGLLAELSATFGADLGITYEILKDLETEDQIGYVLNRAKEAGVLPPEIGASQLDKLWQVFWANHHANHGYTPEEYPGKCVLITAREKTVGKDLDLVETWGSRCKGGIEVHPSAGHHSNMVNKPHVEELAKVMDLYLSK